MPGGLGRNPTAGILPFACSWSGRGLQASPQHWGARKGVAFEIEFGSQWIARDLDSPKKRELCGTPEKGEGD